MVARVRYRRMTAGVALRSAAPRTWFRTSGPTSQFNL